MEHKVSLDQVSDGKLYSLFDQVSVSCSGCNSKAECCCFAEDTITLDPFDFYQFTKFGFPDFSSLFRASIISLSPENMALLPHLSLSKETGRCPFLSSEGRCKIHSFRPGLCRLFPLARYIDGDSVAYLLQVHECPELQKKQPKTTVADWLSLEEPEKYEAYQITYHSLLKKQREELARAEDRNELSALTTSFLSLFFQTPYRTDESFFTQFTNRYQTYLNRFTP